MGRRTTLLMVTAVLLSFGLIMSLNIASLFGYIPSKYISPNDVKGIAVEHNGLLYTLNFQQQNLLINIFNRSDAINSIDFSKRKVTQANVASIKKIIIYRFNAPDIEITPIGYVGKKDLPSSAAFVYSSSEWNYGGYLEEAIPEQTNALLLTTYDK